MKIILNVSNLFLGGGVQVAISFLHELKFIKKKYKYFVFLSNPISGQIEEHLFPKNFKFYKITKPISPLKTRPLVIKELNKLEAEIMPDIVFTLFGPSYWKPYAKNLVGFADPWLLNPTSVAYKQLSYFHRMRRRLLNFYKKYYLKREAKNFIIETNDGKNKLSRYLKIPKNRIFVVNNSISHVFDHKKFLSEKNDFYIKLPKKKKNEFRLLLISNNYPHKNLKIIKDVIPYIKMFNIKFILTLEEKDFRENFQGLDDYIINIKKINLNSCPSIYDQCDALFLPTLLEVFSVSYLESMKMQKPILTSNYSFAKDICGNAALYFDPLDPKDISKKILNLLKNSKLRIQLINNGLRRLEIFKSSKFRAENYLKILNKISKHDLN